MDNIPEPPERSGGIDFDQSDVQAEDLIGRDKFEINLPEIPRKGCYAQLSKNVKFVVSLGVLLFLIYAVFQQLNRQNVSEQTPTPTAAVTETPTGTPEPETTPTVDDQRSLLQTMTPAAPSGRGTAVVEAETATPAAEVTMTFVAALTGSPASTGTPTSRPVPATTTRSAAGPNTPVVRPPTPTPRPTPTSVPPTPRPAPTLTPTPRPPTPNPCPSASVRLGPVAQLATVGDRFTVSVLVSCAVDLAGYQVELRFDPAVVAVRSVSNGGFLAGAGGSVFVAGPEVDNSAGTATIGAIVLRPGPYPTGSGMLASFSLEAIRAGSTELDAGVSLSDLNGQGIPVSVSGAAVVVQANATAIPSSP
ncbi:MAG: hypothetical protein ACE5F6_02135 [Anaerolineae bacterium]